MYCPNCGTQVLADRKFCRFCGADFLTALLALTGKTSACEEIESSKNQEPKLNRRGFIIIWAGIFLAACLLTVGGILAVLDKPVSDLVASSAGYGGLIALIGVGMMIYSRLFPATAAKSVSSELKIAKRANTTGKLMSDPHPEQMMSVTENTTDLLGNYVGGVEKRRRSGDLCA